MQNWQRPFFLTNWKFWTGWWYLLWNVLKGVQVFYTLLVPKWFHFFILIHFLLFLLKHFSCPNHGRMKQKTFFKQWALPRMDKYSWLVHVETVRKPYSKKIVSALISCWIFHQNFYINGKLLPHFIQVGTKICMFLSQSTSNYSQ